MKRAFLIVWFAALVAACGSSVDVKGKSPEEQADQVVGALCEQQVHCGKVSVECAGTPDGASTCTGTIEAGDYDACYADTYADALADFRRVTLTDADADAINSCINEQTSARCVTQAELDAYTDATNRGEEPPFPVEVPPSCATLFRVFGGG